MLDFGPLTSGVQPNESNGSCTYIPRDILSITAGSRPFKMRSPGVVGVVLGGLPAYLDSPLKNIRASL